MNGGFAWDLAGIVGFAFGQGCTINTAHFADFDA